MFALISLVASLDHKTFAMSRTEESIISHRFDLTIVSIVLSLYLNAAAGYVSHQLLKVGNSVCSDFFLMEHQSVQG